LSSLTLAKSLVSPEPLVAPAFLEAKFLEPLKSRGEIEGNVRGTVFVLFGAETAEENSPRTQGRRQHVQGFFGFGNVLEDVHGRDKVNGAGGQTPGFQIKKERLVKKRFFHSAASCVKHEYGGNQNVPVA